MKRLILIRHGETEFTSQRRYCGHEDVPLNGDGIKQIECLRHRLDGVKIDTVYSSDLRRAMQTAGIIFKGRRILKDESLREIDLGAFSGLTFTQAQRLYPKIYGTFLKNPQDVKMPKGESVRGFAKRVTIGFADICRKTKNKTVAIITHGGTIRILLLKISGSPLDKFWTIEQDTAAINIVEFKDGIPKILKINDTSYL